MSTNGHYVTLEEMEALVKEYEAATNGQPEPQPIFDSEDEPEPDFADFSQWSEDWHDEVQV
jgi:hypothetical protein